MFTDKQTQIFALIAKERERQDKKHPLPNGFPKDLRSEILMEEVGEVAKARLERDTVQMRKELIEVAATAVRWIEIMDMESIEGMDRMLELGISPEPEEIALYTNTEGMTYKFSVFKNEDIEQLTHHEKVALGHIAESIEQNRKASGKNPRNTYLGINTDEAYANQVIDILEANGHWGEEWNGWNTR